MKKVLSLGFIMCIVMSQLAQSPISLNNSNMPSSGDTLRYSSALLTSLGNYTQTGTNFNWNFSSLTPINQGVRGFKSAFQTPYAFFFLGLNEYGEKIADTLGAGPLTMTNYYNYYKKQTVPLNAYIADGAGITFSGVPVPNYYSDKDELYVFPMTYPQYDSTTFKFSTSASTIIPIKYSKTGYRITKVDGWGSITTPFGTANCLRIETTQYSQDSIKNNLVPIPLGFANNQRSYQWLTSSSKIPFLEVSGNLVGNNFTVTQVRYRDLPRVITGVQEMAPENEMSIYPNPVKDKLCIHAGDLRIEAVQLFSLTGSLVKTLQPELKGGKEVVLDLSDLSSGVYMMEITTLRGKNSFKIIKE